MGERDRGVGPVPEPPPWPQRSVLAAALAALTGAVLALGPVASPVDAGTPSVISRALESALAGVAPVKAPALLGLLMLALAAVFACRSLERRIGSAAPLLVTLLVFGSGSWALAWTAGAALTPLALAVVAFALTYGGGGTHDGPTELYRPPEPGLLAALRWAVVGLLLAELVPSGLLLAALLVPAALAVPRERRRLLLPLLLAGFAVGLAVELAARGPGLMSGPIALVVESLRVDPWLAGRGLMNLLVGRNVGLLVGFAPALLLLVLGRGSAARPGLVAVCLTLPVLGALLLPFDFAGGWLNLSFLPVYGALWHLPARRPRRWQWAAILLLCGLAGWPLWVSPRQALADNGVRLADAWPRRHLPYESTLRTLPNRGEAQLAAESVRVRSVAGCRFRGDSSRFELDGAGPALIWLAAPQDLPLVGLEFGPGAPSSMEAVGGTAGRTVFRPDGRVGFEVLLDRPRGTHRLWFGEGPLTTHLIEIRMPGWQGDRPLRFRLLATAQP